MSTKKKEPKVTSNEIDKENEPPFKKARTDDKTTFCSEFNKAFEYI